jgi:glycosyltransferase involved in cell wall biosynthesis
LKQEADALIVLNPRDATDIGACIARILTEDTLRQTLSDAGLRFAAQHQWQQAVDAYIDIYKAVIPA